MTILIKNHKTPILPDPVILLWGIHSKKIFSNTIFIPLFKAAKKRKKREKKKRGRRKQLRKFKDIRAHTSSGRLNSC